MKATYRLQLGPHLSFAPGVPDVCQGDELPSFALVDPDNRRPVDWALRRRLLGEVRAGAPVARETAKLHVIVRALALRGERPDAFAGTYEPVDARMPAPSVAATTCRSGCRCGMASRSRRRRAGTTTCCPMSTSASGPGGGLPDPCCPARSSVWVR